VDDDHLFFWCKFIDHEFLTYPDINIKSISIKHYLPNNPD